MQLDCGDIVRREGFAGAIFTVSILKLVSLLWTGI